MFGDADSSPGYYQSGSGGDVKGAAGIASGAAGVYQGVSFGAADVNRGVAGDFEVSGFRPDSFGEADDFLYCLSFHVQCDQESGDLGVAALSGEHLSHHRACLLTRERLVVIGDDVKSVRDHQRRTTVSQRKKGFNSWVVAGGSKLQKLLETLAPTCGQDGAVDGALQ